MRAPHFGAQQLGLMDDLKAFPGLQVELAEVRKEEVLPIKGNLQKLEMKKREWDNNALNRKLQQLIKENTRLKRQIREKKG